MTNIILKFDTSQISGYDGTSFEINYLDSINLYNKNHEIACLMLSTDNMWRNINSSNNKFTYFNGTDWKDIIIPPGNYNLAEIEKALQDGFIAYGDFTQNAITGKKSFSINLIPNYSTTKLYIELLNGYKIDFTTSKLNELFGFDSIIIDSSQYGTKIVDITNGLEEIQLHCSLVGGGSTRFNQNSSDVLISWVPNSPPSGKIYINHEDRRYHSMLENNAIRSVRFYITDQRNRPLNLYSNLIFEVHIRPRTFITI